MVAMTWIIKKRIGWILVVAIMVLVPVSEVKGSVNHKLEVTSGDPVESSPTGPPVDFFAITVEIEFVVSTSCLDHPAELTVDVNFILKLHIDVVVHNVVPKTLDGILFRYGSHVLFSD
jgi:hypothetical protein